MPYKLAERYIGELRNKLAELQELLLKTDIPKDKYDAISEKLTLIERIIARYE